MPPARAAGLTEIVGQTTVRVYPCVPVQPFASVAVTVKPKVPVTRGEPERRPAGESVTPVGSAPPVTANVVVPTPPICVSVAA